MLLDEENATYETLHAQHVRNLHVGGRAPSRAAVTLAMLVCAVLPELLIFPFGSGMITGMPHLDFVRLTPAILGNGMPLSVMLAVFVACRWAAPVDRRYAVVLATIAAGVLRLAIYCVSVLGDVHAAELSWIGVHIIETASLAGAVIAAAVFVDARTPPSAEYRSSASKTQDLPHPDHSLFETVGGYIRSSYSRRRARHQDAERPA